MNVENADKIIGYIKKQGQETVKEGLIVNYICKYGFLC